MTNLLILALSLFTSNWTGLSANSPNISWAAGYCWSASLTYAAPVGRYVVEWNYQSENAWPTYHGWKGMNWSVLNTNFGASYGYFTNACYQTSTVIFPVPPLPQQLFRLKRL